MYTVILGYKYNGKKVILMYMGQKHFYQQIINLFEMIKKGYLE